MNVAQLFVNLQESWPFALPLYKSAAPVIDRSLLRTLDIYIQAFGRYVFWTIGEDQH